MRSAVELPPGLPDFRACRQALAVFGMLLQLRVEILQGYIGESLGRTSIAPPVFTLMVEPHSLSAAVPTGGCDTSAPSAG